ncbi:MAG: class I SAM-dependent rRNA methyltransferase [Simkania sp.]|nr:class I SAM-dependent rRNA methyltransferase [Simkania sp.]
MSSNLTVRLKEGKEKSLERRHPWIFSGAIEEMPTGCQPGELLPVYSSKGKFLALAYFQPMNSLCGRVLSFEHKPILEIFRDKILAAIQRRVPFFTSQTTAYRLINAEGDGLPGLIVDRYDDVLVLQITTSGMERCKKFVVDLLIDIVHPKAVYEKSHGPARQMEGLDDQEGCLWGDCPGEISILENGLRFVVSTKEGQKTGFFLDQREMRKLVRTLSQGKRILNGFAYTGAFSIAALSGGAAHVDSIEISRKAEPFFKKNLQLNGYDSTHHQLFIEDVFDFLSRSTMDYDLVILDPPAFAKKRSDVDAACRGYKQLMVEVMRKARSGSMLLFSSCSHYVDGELLKTLAFQAALDSGREVVLLGRHLQAFDHPISLFHPEGEYLKSLLLFVS